MYIVQVCSENIQLPLRYSNKKFNKNSIQCILCKSQCRIDNCQVK